MEKPQLLPKPNTTNIPTGFLNLETKPSNYYSLSRLDMIPFIPENSKIILDVGCAEGVFGKYLKEKLNAEVWGVDINEEVGKIAEQKLNKVIIGDIMKVIDDLPEGYFDCVVFNDILEHLIDPYKVLLKIKSKLSENGVIVCSIPNVRYFPILKKLIFNKQWEYEDCGVLDKTHLRFFTKKSMEDVLNLSGYQVEKTEGLNPIISLTLSILNILFFGYLSDTKYIQFAYVAKPKKR